MRYIALLEREDARSGLKSTPLQLIFDVLATCLLTASDLLGHTIRAHTRTRRLVMKPGKRQSSI